MKELIDRNQLAKILGTTPETISNQISLLNEGRTIPFSLQRGRKRYWRPETVEKFLKDREAESIARVEAMRAKHGFR